MPKRLKTPDWETISKILGSIPVQVGFKIKRYPNSQVNGNLQCPLIMGQHCLSLYCTGLSPRLSEVSRWVEKSMQIELKGISTVVTTGQKKNLFGSKSTWVKGGLPSYLLGVKSKLELGQGPSLISREKKSVCHLKLFPRFGS